MGVVNVTPDSFSDGGRWPSPTRRVAHGRELLADGADILDIGGESTRPGATRPLVDEELGRVVPVITGAGRRGCGGLRRHHARRGRRGGARGRGARSSTTCPAAWPTRASSTWSRPPDATYVAMHWRAHGDHMRDFAVYDGPGGVVGGGPRRARRAGRGDAGRRHRRRPDRARPGPRLRQAGRAQLGAAAPTSTRSQALGFPLLVGASRKSLPRHAAGRPRRGPAPGRRAGARQHRAHRRCSPQQGVWGLRVHDVRAADDALAAWQALARAADRPRSDTHDRRAGRPRHRVLRPPRRLRLRAARGPDLRDRPRAGHRHRARRRRPTTCKTPSTTEVSWPR